MSASTALKKINARAKALKKKHPGKKYKTLQKQAGAEYRAGKLKAKRPKKTVVKKAAVKRRKPRRKVGKASTVKIYSLGKLIKRKRRKATKKKTTSRRRRVGNSASSSLMPMLLVGGLGLAAYLLLKPTTTTQYQPTGNYQRDNSASNILAYATAAGLGISAITQLITALNNMSDDQVIAANNNPASTVQQLTGPTSTVQAPTGGPSIHF